MRGRPTRLLLWAVLLSLLSLANVCALGMEQAAALAWSVQETSQTRVRQEFVLADPVDAHQPFTLAARVRLPELGGVTDDPEVSEELWLAGLSGAENQPPTLLALSWRLDTSGWYPMWKLRLRSDAGLLPVQGNLLDLGPYQPVGGGEYTTLLSYDAGLGALSLRIIDESAGQVVFSNNFELGVYSGTIYPGVGSQGEHGDQFPALEVKELVVQPCFIPFGARARLVTTNGTDSGLVNINAVDRRLDHAVDLSLPQRPLEGRLRVISEANGSRAELVAADRATGSQLLPIPSTLLPVGVADLVLEYEVDGVAWELARKQLQVGFIGARLGDLDLVFGDDDKLEMAGTIELESDGAMPPFSIDLAFDVSVPGTAAPLNQSWFGNSVSANVPIAALAGEATSIPFRLPLRISASRAVGKESFVEASVSADLDPGVAFVYGGAGRFVIGERASVFPKVGEYTVLRGDFHAHTTLSDGSLVPTERVWEFYTLGFDTVALTDHRTVAAYEYGSAEAARLGLTLVKGFETGIAQGEHLVVLGTDDAYRMRDEHGWSRQPDSATVFYQDQVREVIAHGGFIIYAHPNGELIPPNSSGSQSEEIALSSEMEWIINQGYLGGVECKASVPVPRRDSAFRWALEYGLTLFDVSDIHAVRNRGNSYRFPLTLVLVRDNSESGVMDALQNGRTIVWRDGELRGAKTWLVPFMDALLDLRLIERDGESCLQITNKGAISVYGVVEVDGEENRPVVLSPGSNVCLPSQSGAASARITWSNVHCGPGEALITEHLILSGSE